MNKLKKDLEKALNSEAPMDIDVDLSNIIQLVQRKVDWNIKSYTLTVISPYCWNLVIYNEVTDINIYVHQALINVEIKCHE